jgi:UDP-N-acetylglucosamine acyltransferase
VSVSVHPTAAIADGARLADGVSVGPFCVIGPAVTLGEGVTLEAHVAVAGATEIGPRTRIWPFASIGHAPQDLKYRGEPTRLVIGADCMIREHVTMNTGTVQGAGVTRVGDRGLFMVGAHVGHDCVVGDDVVFANNATLGGHVEVGDQVVLGGLSAVHQRVRIGRGAMVGGMTGVEKDVIPYGLVIGDRARLAGLNLVGLKRRGVAHDEIHRVRAAYRAIFVGPGALAERAADAARAFADCPRALEIAAFITADSSRSFCTPDAAA